MVVGGGPGGYAAAFLAADLGMQVTLVDLEPQLGGVCLLRGCIPSKALLHLAKTMDDARHLAEWGVRFAAPTIDLAAVRARKEKVIATLAGGLKQIAGKRNVSVVRAKAVLEDSQTLRLAPVDQKPLADDRLRFEHCILATGSGPLRIPALESPDVAADHGFHRRPGAGRRARVAAGGGRRLHRPGNGMRVRRPGQPGVGGGIDRRPAAGRRPRPGPTAGETTEGAVRGHPHRARKC